MGDQEFLSFVVSWAPVLLSAVCDRRIHFRIRRNAAVRFYDADVPLAFLDRRIGDQEFLKFVVS